MAQILKMLELADEDGVAQMQIGRQSDRSPLCITQRAALAGTQQNALAKVLLADQFGKAFACEACALLVDVNRHFSQRPRSQAYAGARAPQISLDVG